MKTRKIFSLLLAVSLATFALLPAFPHQASAAVSNWQKGVTISPRWNTDFDSGTFQQSVRNAAAMHANYITLVIPLYQSNIYSTDVQTGWNTPTDQSLIDAVNFIHGLGLHVMFKPHLDSYDGQWRANINPGDRNTWFTNYGNLMMHYATIAQQTGVEEFCVGAELISMATATSNGTNTNNWYSLIGKIRSTYSGLLTYSANWGPQGTFADEFNNINFWNALDSIGISAYFNLSSNTNNDTTQLENSWSGYNAGEITPIHNKYNKPVLFTEIGYKSVSGAHWEPWNSGRSGSYDPTEQATDYNALFDYWNNQSFMIGVQLWDWNSDPNYGGSGNTDYTPQNKPAQDTISQWFSGGTNPTPNPTPTPSVSCANPATNAFSGCYYNDMNLGTPVLSRTDNSINFDWGMGSPDPAVHADNFSARWQGNFNFNTGSYTFTMTSDDGARLYIDNQLVLDKWIDQPATTYTVTQNMTAGTHLIKMEYYENGGNAVAKLSWNASTGTTPPPTAASCASPATGSFTGCYYSGQSFDNLALSRNDSAVNFDWGSGSPDPSVPSDHFSVRWQGNFNFTGGTYTFTATGDDGIRVYVDNNLIINQWADQPATTFTSTQNISAGTHLIKVEYYEDGGNAVAKVSWAQGGGTVIPPPNNPPPSSGSSTIVYVNGYPTVNGNYIDCDGTIDNDMAHHTTNPSDTDPAHHLGQNCPAGSYVATHSS